MVVCWRTYLIVATSLSMMCCLYFGDSNTNSDDTTCIDAAERNRAIQLTPSSKTTSNTRLYAPQVYFSLTMQLRPSRRALAIVHNPCRSTRASMSSNPFAIGESLLTSSEIPFHFADTELRIGTGEVIWVPLGESSVAVFIFCTSGRAEIPSKVCEGRKHAINERERLEESAR